MRKSIKIKIFLILAILLFPFFIQADSIGQGQDFYVEPSYDFNEREEITTTLRNKSDKLYFYIDNSWWDSLDSSRKNEIQSSLDQLALAFEEEIYPNITSAFGFEWKPGIDDKEEITVLFHRMKNKAAGYFNSGDEYSKLQNPSSNEREMIYLNTDYITDDLIDSYLAHEFVHLITFNQKDKEEGVTEEVWLNEARAEYAPTLAGYDSEYSGSNLESRVGEFLNNPSDSLTEWKKKAADYGALNLFTQYLVGQYGVEILSESLKSDQVGIQSLNQSLEQNGFNKDFSQIFLDWTIASLINDCSSRKEYCYKNENLKNLRVVPNLNFLPLANKTSLTIEDSIKDWSGRWYKLMGGRGDLEIDFKGVEDVDFHVFYLACKKNQECVLNKMVLDQEQKGNINISNFGEEYSYLTIILSTQEKTEGFGSSETAHPFSFKALAKEKEEEKEPEPEPEENEAIQALLDKISLLQAEVARLQAKINALLGNNKEQTFDQNLYFGMMNNLEVERLQEFLKGQGNDIYPEGLITGNFLSMTKTAIIRFQEKHADKILNPLGLSGGTGYFGSSTRSFINALLD